MDLVAKWSRTGLLEDIRNPSKKKLYAEKLEEFGKFIIENQESYGDSNSGFFSLYFRILKFHLNIYNSVDTEKLVDKVSNYYNTNYDSMLKLTNNNEDFANEELFNLFIKYEQ